MTTETINPTVVNEMTDKLLAQGKRVVSIEAQAVQSLVARIDEHFVTACQYLIQCIQSKGRIVIMGMGKSGHIGRKMAATFSSTGSPAIFVHPAEACHGDMGMVTEHDTIIAISNSGESEEIARVLP